jgi:hypothetical protein
LFLKNGARNNLEKNIAHVAQLVEHVLGKDEVIGSNPIVGSRIEQVVPKLESSRTGR